MSVSKGELLIVIQCFPLPIETKESALKIKDECLPRRSCKVGNHPQLIHLCSIPLFASTARHRLYEKTEVHTLRWFKTNSISKTISNDDANSKASSVSNLVRDPSAPFLNLPIYGMWPCVRTLVVHLSIASSWVQVRQSFQTALYASVPMSHSSLQTEWLYLCWGLEWKPLLYPSSFLMVDILTPWSLRLGHTASENANAGFMNDHVE